MIGLLVVLCSMYRYIFSDWTLSKDECAMFVVAVGIEIVVEVLIGFGIMRAFKDVKP